MVQSYKHEENPGKFFRSGGHNEYLQNFFKAVIENNPELLEKGKKVFTEKDFNEFYDKLYENIVACELGWKGNVSGNWIQKVIDLIANILTLLHDKIFSKKFAPANYEKQFNEISSKLEVLFENDINFEGDKAEKNIAILQNLTILADKCLLARSQKGAKHFETTNSLDSYINKIFNAIEKTQNGSEISEHKNFSELVKNFKNDLFVYASINILTISTCKISPLPKINFKVEGYKDDDFNIQISKLKTVEHYGNLFKKSVNLATETNKEFEHKENGSKYPAHLEVVESLLVSLAKGNQTDLSKSNLDLIEKFIDGTIELTKEQVEKENKAKNPTDNPNEKILSTLSNTLKLINKSLKSDDANKNNENINKVISIIINTEIKLYGIQASDLMKHINTAIQNPKNPHKEDNRFNFNYLVGEIFDNFSLRNFVGNFNELINIMKEKKIDITFMNLPQISK